MHNRDIEVFQSLTEIPYITFPTNLDRLLLVVCTAGSIEATIDVTKRRVEPNDIMVLKPGHLITDCKSSPDFQGFFITATQERLSQLFPCIRYLTTFSIKFNENPVIHINDDELQSLKLIHDLLRRHLSGTKLPYHSMALVALCEVLFYNTLGLYSSRMSHDGAISRREELLNRFVEILDRDFKTERSVAYYADKLFVTPKHLSAVLKDTSNRSASEWIDQRVIHEAKLLLRSTGLNIQEISAQLNFANQSFFGKYFKHLTGVSPRDYRNKLSDK